MGAPFEHDQLNAQGNVKRSSEHRVAGSEHRTRRIATGAAATPPRSSRIHSEVAVTP
jgi:hypothetical protein